MLLFKLAAARFGFNLLSETAPGGPDGSGRLFLFPAAELQPPIQAFKVYCRRPEQERRVTGGSTTFLTRIWDV